MHGRPLHPQTQGKVERFHRTLKAEILRDATYSDLGAAQAAFADWQAVYNHERPHHALDRDVPASRYRPNPRPFPEVVPPLEYDPEDAVRIVARSGQVHYRNRAVFVSQALAGQRVAVRPTLPDGVVVVCFGQAPLGTIDLHQPTLVLDRTAAQPIVGG